MLLKSMKIFSYSSRGYDGDLIEIEISNFKRSLPGIEIVGLPGNAVKESKVRVRSAILNMGYEFPKGRIILNMAPAGERKEGAIFDLAFALSILNNNSLLSSVMVLGELTLSGNIRKVKGVLPAVLKGKNSNIDNFIVPFENREEASLLNYGNIYPVKTLTEAIDVINNKKVPYKNKKLKNKDDHETGLDFRDIIGLKTVKRSAEIAVAGGHNLFIFGPPGVGKSMVLNRINSITPDLTINKAIESSMVWSIAGKVDSENALIRRPPIRKPHHGASLEGLIGGGSNCSPGEISLAHNGYLLLDELPEFKTNIIQSLREPLEDKIITLNRARNSTWYPADFQIIASANPCPCGNLGKKNSICMCSDKEIRRYWKKIGGAIMDRIDLRVPVTSQDDPFLNSGEDSYTIKNRVLIAKDIQENRFKKEEYSCNAKIPPGHINSYCILDDKERTILRNGVEQLSLSSRGLHSVLKLCRTIADLDNSEKIGERHIIEALSFRRYGDDDLYFI